MRRLLPALLLVAGVLATPARGQSITVTGTFLESDDVTPCNRCEVVAQQVSGIQGSSVTYSGSPVATRAATDGTWSLELVASTDYEFRFYFTGGGMQTDPPEIRTVCAAEPCAYPGGLTKVAGGQTAPDRPDFAIEDDNTVIEAAADTLDFTTGIQATAGAGGEVLIAVDGTVVRTTGPFTIGGTITHGVIPVLPSSDPTTDDQAARKYYVDRLQRVTGLSGDTGSATPTNGQVLSVAGGDGVTTSGAGVTLTIDVDGTVLRQDGSVQLAGNLSASPGVTVDGRDLSVDGAKLDGVEAGAQADQLAADVPLADAGAFFVGADVEAALQEVGPTMTDARTPTTHAASHVDGGADELRAEQLATLGATGTAPLSDGLGGLAMADVLVPGEVDTESELEGLLADVTNVFTDGDTIPDGNLPASIARDSELHDALTLAAGRDYLSLAGQVLTLGPVDLATDVTGEAPDANVAQDLTIVGGSVSASDIRWELSATPAQTEEGRPVWDSDDDELTVGNGAGGRVTFHGGPHTVDTDTNPDGCVGCIDSGEVLDGTLVDADINAAAGIGEGKLTFTTNDGSRHDHHGADLTAGSIPDARIPASNVTQHQAALSIAESQVPDGTALVRVGDTFTGDVTATLADGSTDLQLATGIVGAAELASTPVTPGSYTAADLTVDADGRVTAAASGQVDPAEADLGASWDFQLGELALPRGTTCDPLACDEAAEHGRTCVDTDAPTGQQFYVCEGLAGWVLQGDGGGAGEANTASSVGGGLALFKQKSGVDLEFRTFDVADFDLSGDLLQVDDTRWARDDELHAAVTVSGAPDYLTIVGQDLVRGLVDLGTDTTGTLAAGSVGNGLTDAQVADTLTIGSGSTITLPQSLNPTPTVEGRLEWDTDDNELKVGDGAGTVTLSTGPHTVDTQADEVCAGTDTYLDGEGNCDNLAPLYVAVGDTVIGDVGITFVDGSSIASITAGAVDAAELASTAVTPGSYTLSSITVDADGRLTSASSGNAGINAEEMGVERVSAAQLNGFNFQAGFDLVDNGGQVDITLDYTEDPVDLATPEVTGDLPEGAVREGTSGQMLISSSAPTPVPTWRTLSGDVTTNAAGVMTIASNAVGSPEVTDGSLTTADTAFDPIEEGELDTEGELEAQLTDAANVIVSTEIDTAAEINALTTDEDLLTESGGTVSGMLTVTGTVDASGGTTRIQRTTVAGLPACAAGLAGVIMIVTDGASAGDCATGLGATKVFCECDGTTWASLGDGGPGGSGDDVLIDGIAITDGSGVDLIGGVGVDWTLDLGVSPDTATLALDTTEVTDTTWGGGAQFDWTLDASATTDPVIRFYTNGVDVITGILRVSGNPVVVEGDAAGGDLAGTYPDPTIAANAVALATDTTGNFVADITAGDGLVASGGGAENATVTLDTQSDEAGFLEDGGTTDLVCGVGSEGKSQVMDNGQIQYCDGNATSVLRKGFLDADGVDAGSDLSVEEDDVEVDALTTTLDFGSGLDVTESPPGEINVVLDYTEDPPDLGTAEVTGTLTVAKGGTGATSMTDGGVVLGSGTGAVTVTAQPTHGQLLIGSTGSDPVLATLTGGDGVIVGIGPGSTTVETLSIEAGFLEDGGAASLTCGASNQGKAQVMDDGSIEYCDGATTSVLRAGFLDADGVDDDVPESGDFGAAGALEADGTLSTDAVDAITELAAELRTGTDAELVTGTAGTSGNCAEWDANGDLVDAGATCDTSTSHAMLSATHSDTTVGTVARGDLITGQTATPKWQRLVIGGAGTVLTSDGTDISWGADDDQPDSDAEVPDAITVSGGSVTSSTITLDTGANPTADGQIRWDSTTERIEVGDDGVATLEFYPGAHTTARTDEEIEDTAGAMVTGNTETGITVTYQDADGTLDFVVDLGTDVDLTSEVTGTLPVASGGTGATTFTDGGVLLGSGTGAITALGVASAGQLLIGDGTTDPVLATLTEGTAIDVTNGVGSITVGFDSTEVKATTWGSGTPFTWTFDPGSVDPTFALGSSGDVTLTSQSGSMSVFPTLSLQSKDSIGTTREARVDGDGLVLDNTDLVLDDGTYEVDFVNTNGLANRTITVETGSSSVVNTTLATFATVASVGIPIVSQGTSASYDTGNEVCNRSGFSSCVTTYELDNNPAERSCTNVYSSTLFLAVCN